MKTSFLITLFCLLLSIQLHAQEINRNYDEALAKELKADEFGMKKYVLVILKTSNTPGLPKSTRDSVFKGHMANINRLAIEGKLVVAGPHRSSS